MSIDVPSVPLKMNGLERNPPHFRFQAPAPTRVTLTPIPTDSPRSEDEALTMAQVVGKAIREFNVLLPSLDGADRAALAREITLLIRYQKQLLDYADELAGTPEWITRLCKLVSDFEVTDILLSSLKKTL